MLWMLLTVGNIGFMARHILCRSIALAAMASVLQVQFREVSC